MSKQVAIIGALKILVDGGKDVALALKPGETLAQKIAHFENLIPDAMAEMSVIGDIGEEIKALQPADYASLAGVLVSDLGLSDPHAQSVAQAGVKLLADVAAGAPDLIGFIHAVKNSPAT